MFVFVVSFFFSGLLLSFPDSEEEEKKAGQTEAPLSKLKLEFKT